MKRIFILIRKGFRFPIKGVWGLGPHVQARSLTLPPICFLRISQWRMQTARACADWQKDCQRRVRNWQISHSRHSGMPSAGARAELIGPTFPSFGCKRSRAGLSHGAKPHTHKKKKRGLFPLFFLHALQSIYKSQYRPDFTAGHLLNFFEQFRFFGSQLICG